VIARETDWSAANQRALSGDIGRVRAQLERHAGLETPTRKLARDECTQSALALVCDRFALSPFERDLLLLCAGTELDAEFAPLCAHAQGNAAFSYPTFGLALAALEAPHWSALTPHRPLRAFGLIELGIGPTLATTPLRINEALLHELVGIEALDGVADAIVRPLAPAGDIAPSHAHAAQRIADFFAQSEGAHRVLMLTGADLDGKRRAVTAAGTLRGRRAYRCSASALPGATAGTGFARAWSREARLHHVVLLVEAHDGSDVQERAALARTLEAIDGNIVLATRARQRFGELSMPALDVGRPNPSEQLERWTRALHTGTHQTHAIERLTDHFDLSATAIDAAAALARVDGDDTIAAAWRAARASSRADLDDVATRLEARVERADLVLPAEQRATIDDLIAHVHQRATVYGRWCMRANTGTGVGALFFGPSGTGKSLAAATIATELDLDLYRIDLSQVVSKYIGETEKILARVFEAAEESGAILLFDECDALFGKRGEIGAAHDRYANVEVSYLLARMESYRGLAILTTNMRGAIDPAFMRRLRFVVPFPFPDYEQRCDLWRRAFSPQVPLDNIDFEKLARLHVAGGNIRNIALYAASIAAHRGEPVGMEHLLRAAQAECVKIERAPSSLELGGWV